MWSALVLAVVRPLALAVAALPAPRPDGPVPVPAAPETVRVECFAVAAPGAEAEPVAVVRLVRLDGPGRTLLEREVVLRAEGWRVHHTERLEGSARRLVWREFGPRGARAWIVDWDLADASAGRRATAVGYGWARPTHEQHTAAARWVGALEWEEAARDGALARLGPVAWLAPPRAVDGRARTAHLASSADALASGPEGRLTFASGAAPGSPAALAEFTLGAPHLVARPLVEAEFRRLAGRWAWRAPARPLAVEAALRRDESLRALAARFEAGERFRW